MTTTWTVHTPSGPLKLNQPYGHECQLEGPGYRASILLSPLNLRIQVYEYKATDHEGMTRALMALAQRNAYGKVWVKAPARDEQPLAAAGFVREASIQGYFDGKDAVVMSLFPYDAQRQHPVEAEQDEQVILQHALAGEPSLQARELPPGYKSWMMVDSDAEELAELYARVFPTYPYPIDEPQYLIDTANTNVIYRIVRNAEGRLVAAASAETAPRYRNAEMTDFAALPSERGLGLALYLLLKLERDARKRFDIQCYYTIARAMMGGMLRTFHHAGYVLTGTLVNNCNIGGQFETMHVMVRDEKIAGPVGDPTGA